jgi:Zn-finger nucleic acid-binding protein
MPPQSSSLNCPNCGAAAATDATRCDYCGSRLAVVACPSCFGSMFLGAQFCPHCGTKIQAPEAAEGKTLKCPGCAGDMHPVRLGATSMHQCDQCASAWLAPNDFASLCSNREERGTVMTSLGAGGVAARAPDQGKVRYVHCAVCDKVMNRVNFGKMSGIIIDVCKNHGVWFERDELRGVLQFVANGGLDRMRATEAERKASQLSAIGLDPGISINTSTFASNFTIPLPSGGGSNAHSDDLASATLSFVLKTLFS